MFGRYAAECAVSHSAEFNHGIVSSALFARVPLAELGKWAADWVAVHFTPFSWQRDEVNVLRHRSSVASILMQNRILFFFLFREGFSGVIK